VHSRLEISPALTGPHTDPGKARQLGRDGFRIWITDEPDKWGQRCYCGWLDGRDHYGTVLVIDEAGRRLRWGVPEPEGGA
jgi:hypothetical protein